MIEKHASDIVLPDPLGVIASELRDGLGNRGCEAIYPALAKGRKNEKLKFH